MSKSEYGPVAMPANTYSKAGALGYESEAHVFVAWMKENHRKPELSKLKTFKQFRVSWYSVSYNEQGFLEMDFVAFLDGSAWDKKEGIDMTWMRS